jgi:hypothetical protein
LTNFATTSGKKKEQIIGIVYLTDINNNRLKGSAVRSFKTVRTFVGEAAAKHIVAVTSQWDRARDQKAANRRHDELRRHPNFFREVLAQGGVMMKYRKGDDTSSIINAILNKYR